MRSRILQQFIWIVNLRALSCWSVLSEQSASVLGSMLCWSLLSGRLAIALALRCWHFLTCNGADECFGVLGLPRGLCLSPWLCRACALFTWLFYGDLESERVLAVRCRPVSTKHRSSRVHLLRRGVTLR